MSETQPTTSEAAMLQEFLRDRDVTCPRCEYNLRNLAGTRCPECGDELALRVNLVEPKLAAFLTALVGIAAGAGFFILLLVFALIEGGMPSNVGIILLGGSFVTAACLASLLGWRHLIRRLSIGYQWLIAIVCWTITIAGLAVFTINVR